MQKRGFSSFDFAMAIFISMIVISFTVYFVSDYYGKDIQKKSKYTNKIEEELIENYFFSEGEPYYWEDENNLPIKPGLVEKYYYGFIFVNSSENTEQVVEINISFDPNCENLTKENTIRLYKEGKEIPFTLCCKEYCPGGYLKSAKIIFATNTTPERKKYKVIFSPNEKISSGNFVIKPEIVSFWKFDEGYGSGTWDSSGYSYYGSITSGTWSPGVVQTSLYFDGANTKVETNQTFSHPYITICAWIKPEEVRNETIINGWVDSGVFKLGYYDLFTDCSNTGTLDDGFVFSVNTSTGSIINVCSSSGKSIGNWYFVCGVFDGNDASIYLNLSQVGTYSVSDILNPSGSKIYFGEYPGESLFKGYLDEVIIYNKSITEEEMRNLFERNFLAVSVMREEYEALMESKINKLKEIDYNSLKSLVNTKRNFNITICDKSFGKRVPENAEVYVKNTFRDVILENGTLKHCKVLIKIW